MKYLALLLMARCAEQVETPNSSQQYQIYQCWTVEGKSYSVNIINDGVTNKIFKHFDNKFYEERYRNGVLVEVIEYQ